MFKIIEYKQITNYRISGSDLKKKKRKYDELE